jgi:hypothetical protein
MNHTPAWSIRQGFFINFDQEKYSRATLFERKIFPRFQTKIRSSPTVGLLKHLE